MSMTYGSSLTERTADVGCYDDDDSDNDSRGGEQDEEDESHEIGYLGSYAIAINSLAGPAVLQLPFQYQQSGFVATTLALLGVAIVSVACSMYICRVVQAIPPTAKLERPIELSTVVDYFWSRKVCVFAGIKSKK
jgi:Tryptophan/tyrosine permease family